MKNIKIIVCSILCFALLIGTVAFADENALSNQTEQIATTSTESSENAVEVNTAVVTSAETAEIIKEENALPETTESTETTGSETENNNGNVTADNPTDAETVEPAPVVSDEIKVSVNGKIVIFDDVKPQISDGRTLVPFRKVGDAMNAAVAWRATDRTAHYFRNGVSVMLTIGKPEMVVREYEMGEKFVYTTEAEVSAIDPDQPSVIARTINGRTMIPIRATAEALGAKVDWDDATRTVIITIPEYSLKLADKDAAALIENWNYKPATELKTDVVEKN